MQNPPRPSDRRERLAVCGWSDQSDRLLRLLAEHAGLEAVAVGDAHAGALVRARAATGRACYQHLHEMVRTAEYDALLIDGATPVGDIAEVAAARGADLLLVGEHLDGAALEAAARAAGRHQVALGVIRPLLSFAQCSLLIPRMGADDGWRPTFVNLEVREERPALAQTRDAIALLTRLLPDRALELAASVAGPSSNPVAMTVQLRLESGGLASVTARRARWPELHLTALAPSGNTELISLEGYTNIEVTHADGSRESTRLRHDDTLEAEAIRMAEVRAGDHLDLLLASREAATLRAIERAVERPLGESVEDNLSRPPLRMLLGGGHASTLERARLTLVTS